MKKNIFALTIFCLLSEVFAFPVSAYQSWIERECPKEADVELVFTSSYGKLKYITGRSSDYLQKQAPEKAEKGYKILGLTVPNPTLEVNIETSVIAPSVGDDVCVVPKRVEIFFGYIDPVIYIASDLKNKKCRKALTLRHEQTHQQINILALTYFLPQMKKLIRKKVDTLKPVIVNNNRRKKAAEQMNDVIMNRMSDLVAQFNNFLSQEQDKLDNQQNYDFEASVCND